eukprot:5981593-Prymnesium_polylepis.1
MLHAAPHLAGMAAIDNPRLSCIVRRNSAGPYDGRYSLKKRYSLEQIDPSALDRVSSGTQDEAGGIDRVSSGSYDEAGPSSSDPELGGGGLGDGLGSALGGGLEMSIAQRALSQRSATA